MGDPLKEKCVSFMKERCVSFISQSPYECYVRNYVGVSYKKVRKKGCERFMYIKKADKVSCKEGCLSFI